uniref:Uncharacterized protein n=1 Tax=Phaseolus vulgaris TaxID=3885 RepID=V7CZE6_PHAVU|nr:hypothetical protein PHAVU_001G138900g [Phaseolus vulgaris]ESW34276.1 hypothetical protein PHAVU_001G138900g [Phaseolus vulgaris]
MADYYQDYILLFITCLVSTIVVRAILSRKRNKSNRPPSPQALPIIGHLHLLSPIPHQALHKLSTRYGPIMHLFLGSVPSACSQEREGGAIDVGRELLTLSNNVVSRMIMSQTCSEDDSEAEEVRKLVQDTVLLIGKFNVSDFVCFFKNWDVQGFGKRLKEIRDRFDTMMERAIKEHQEERKKRKEVGNGGDGQIKDLLDVLLDIHENENSDIKLTKENIKAFILDVFMAGTDTAASTIVWALAELINHPDVMERAREEIDAVIGSGRLVEESDLVNLSYLQAIVKETLRIHPTGPLIVRESSESCTIWGYEIPPKTQLFVNVWAIGRDPKHWENPLEFRPERFLSEEENGKSQLDVRGQYFHLIPFGSGRRGCPGTSLALQVVQTNLAAMIQCFEWKVKGGNETVDMEEKPGITLSRAHPLVCVPVPRLNPFPPL